MFITIDWVLSSACQAEYYGRADYLFFVVLAPRYYTDAQGYKAYRHVVPCSGGFRVVFLGLVDAQYHVRSCYVVPRVQPSGVLWLRCSLCCRLETTSLS